jgi:hypothetical protein
MFDCGVATFVETIRKRCEATSRNALLVMSPVIVARPISGSIGKYTRRRVATRTSVKCL